MMVRQVSRVCLLMCGCGLFGKHAVRLAGEAGEDEGVDAPMNDGFAQGDVPHERGEPPADAAEENTANTSDAGESTDALIDTDGPSSLGCTNDGSRLQARWYRVDEHRVLRDWFDTERGESCTFRRSPDGVWRCMPESQRYGAFKFADANCTLALIWSAAEIAPRYAKQGISDHSCSDPNFYPVGVSHTPETVYDLVGSECVPRTPTQGVVYYELGPPLDLGSFLSATLSVAPGSTRIREQIIHGEDGSVERCDVSSAGADIATGHWTPEKVDTLRGEECRPWTDDQGTVWIPSPSAYPSVFADSQCENLTVVSVATACGDPEPRYAVVGHRDSMDACISESFSIHTLGETPSVVYYPWQDSCFEYSSLDLDFPVRRLGAEVPRAEFAELDLAVVSDGLGRLERQVAESSDGSRWALPQFFDQERGETCSLKKAADGTTRCLPGGPTALRRFADSGCTEEYNIAWTPTGSLCEDAPPAYASERNTWSRRWRVFPVLDPIPVPERLYVRVFERCVPDTVYPGQYYAIGPELDPDLFVQATE